MARDIKLVWNKNTLAGDIEYDNGDYTREEGLCTAVLISLFTDARASDDDVLDNSEDKRGCWMDCIFGNFGSKLWLCDRMKTDTLTITKVKKYIEESLQWMINDKVAQKIIVEAERFGYPGNDKLGVKIDIYQSYGNNITITFDDLWKGEMNAIY